MTVRTATMEGVSGPWYRERWPWLLMAGPAAVVVAGTFTAVLAVTSSDGLVSDDYYKAGLAVNQDLRRDRAAAEGHYAAQVMISPDGGRVRVILTGEAMPQKMTLKIVHPTRAGADQSAALAQTGPGIYEAPLQPASAGTWIVVLEGPDWRLGGNWHAGRESAVRLAPR